MIRCWTGKRSNVNFSIRIKGSAAKELKTVAGKDRIRIINVIDRLAKNPLSGKALKGNLRGLRSLRTGDYRVLYEVQNNALTILVIRVAHRSGAYQ